MHRHATIAIAIAVAVAIPNCSMDADRIGRFAQRADGIAASIT
jgi:hypothetical protein